jgi:hypothetical protein
LKTRIIIVAVIAGCFLFGLWFWNLRNAVLRFDGVYQTDRRTAPGTGVAFHTYVRFFPDGKFAFSSIAESGTKGAPLDVRRMMAGTQSRVFDPSFSQKGRSVRFTAVHPAGLVDYDGKIGAKGIHFAVHSRINGVNGEEDFTFYPFEPTTAP